MKLTTLVAITGLANAAQAVDYFFQFLGGNPTIHGQRLRLNNSIPYLSPGVSEPPYNPDDHFSRLQIDEETGSILYVIPTHPHPPPIPGYYALDGSEDVDAAGRLVMTYRVNDEGADYRYTDWKIKTSCEGKKLLRYKGDSASRWIAVEETTDKGVKRWVPWWVKPTAENMGNLTSWEYDIVDLELVEAKGPVNSNAPGGVEE